MSDTAISILAGGGIALGSFGLAVAWDLIKAGRTAKARERALVGNLSREMVANRHAITSNLVMIKTELGDLDAKKTLGHANPLARMEMGAWQLLRIELPSAIAEDAELLRRLEILVAKGGETNGKIESRERFQIQHLAGNPDFVVAGLTTYDNLLVHTLEDLMQRIDEAQADLAPLLLGFAADGTP